MRKACWKKVLAELRQGAAQAANLGLHQPLPRRAVAAGVQSVLGPGAGLREADEQNPA